MPRSSFYDLKERCIFCDIIRHETTAGVRLISETDRSPCSRPMRRAFRSRPGFCPSVMNRTSKIPTRRPWQNLAWILRTTMRKIDKVLERPAYNFIVHSAPVQEGRLAHYHWHIEIIPKLTKVAGFEWGTGFYINPTPPEESAQFLREAGLG